MGLVSAGPAGAQTLADTLASTYTTNPELRGQIDQLRATTEQFAQAESGLRPSVQVQLQSGFQRSETIGATFGAPITVDTPNSQSITVIQPIYSGGQTLASIRQSRAVIRSARRALGVVESQVLLEAATAFMDVIQQQAVVQLARNNEEVLQRQLQASRDRFEVGEVTRTDVSQAESRVAGARSDTIQAEGNLRAVRATFERVVGLAPDRLVPPAAVVGLPRSLEEATDLAVTNNSNVRAAVFNVQAAEENVDFFLGELRPSVSLNGSVANALTPTDFIDRNTDASITAQVIVPLYQGGASRSRVREARHGLGQARLQVDEARATAVEAAIQAWEGLAASRASIDSILSQVEAAEIALEGVQQEALVGSRTVLDVLDAEQELLDARVALVQAERNEIVAAFQVLASIGQLSASSLGLPVDIYDFEGDFQRVQNRWFGLGND